MIQTTTVINNSRHAYAILPQLNNGATCTRVVWTHLPIRSGLTFNYYCPVPSTIMKVYVTYSSNKCFIQTDRPIECITFIRFNL